MDKIISKKCVKIKTLKYIFNYLKITKNNVLVHGIMKNKKKYTLLNTHV